MVEFIRDLVGWGESKPFWVAVRVAILAYGLFLLVWALAVGVGGIISNPAGCLGPPPGTPYNGPGPGP